MKKGLCAGLVMLAAASWACTSQRQDSAQHTVAAVPGESVEAAATAEPGNGFPGFASLAQAADPHAWAPWFPNQYMYWKDTAVMRETVYGGGGRRAAEQLKIEKINYLELYPFLKITYDGFPFSKGYYRSRGHFHALTDVVDTQRLPDWDRRPAACLSCKSSDVVVQTSSIGDAFYAKSFAEVVGKNTVSCLDCHDHTTAAVTVQRDYVFDALAHRSFKHIAPEGRADLVCAQCHVNYHFHETTGKPVMPWSSGLSVEDQFAHYNAARRSDEWVHPVTGALVAKIQHPEYELYHEGRMQNIHSGLGLGCNDCHMPQKKDAHGNRFSSHTWTSPLTHVETPCLDCHDWSAGETVARAQAVQHAVYEKQNRIGAELAAYITALGEKRHSGALAPEVLKKAQAIHREAQFYWDFIWVENSNGFHNWEEAHRVLDNAERLIREGMVLIEPPAF